MKTSLLSLFAGTVFLAGSAIANAGEPITLTSAELDTVTAAGIYVKITTLAIEQVSDTGGGGPVTSVNFTLAQTIFHD
jgi:hypothetical protein